MCQSEFRALPSRFYQDPLSEIIFLKIPATINFYDWEHLNRLHEKEYIDNPRNKNKSVIFTEEVKNRAEGLFNKYFGKNTVLIDSSP